MIRQPMDVLAAFPIRKSAKQKQAFRDAVQSYAESLGYACRVEKGSLGCRNLIIGDPDQAKYVVTAHYDTPAGMIFPNLITPCNPVTFFLYQLAVVFVILGLAFGLGYGIFALTEIFFLGYYGGLLFYFLIFGLMMFGPANRNNANDNTSGVVTLLEIATSLPVLHRKNVCFVLFDLEEAGLIGSSSYRKMHKTATDHQIILNMDCVGDGDEILLFPTKDAKKDSALMDQAQKICGWFGQKSIQLRARGFSYYPSDQKNFPKAFGIAAFRRKRFIGLYCSKIHTWRDTTLEQTNVNILRAAISTWISGSAVN